MSNCGCNKTLNQTCNNCTPTSYLNACDGCIETSNTDCIIYTGDRLSFEPVTVKDGSARTLSSILTLIEGINTERETKFIKFHSDGETNDGDAYTVVAEDINKILMITFYDEGVPGTITNTITLPVTSEFINKELIFKDISAPADSGDTTLVYQFNTAIQYNWNPVQTTNLYYTLDSPNKVVRLRLIAVSDLSYAWVIVD
jgi:hypothetical protein